MALTELKKITEPNGERPIENSELFVIGEDFDDFYFAGEDKKLMLGPALTELIRTRFPENADEVLNIALSVARRQKRDADFHPIANGQKELTVIEAVHGDGGGIYLAVKPLP